MPTSSSVVPPEPLEEAIFELRGERVLLDFHLARLYGVETRTLVQSVKRNLERFPPDFMFQLTSNEFANLRSHIVTSRKWGGRRYAPYAFTEQGVAMLSSILRSRRAVMVNIEIMRAFLRLRRMMACNTELAKRIDELEAKYDGQFKAVFEAIRQLMAPTNPIRPQIGYCTAPK